MKDFYHKIKNINSSQIHVNMLSGGVMTSVNILVMGLSYPLYLHYLGYERYGIWLVLAVVLSVAQLGNLGIGAALIKLISQEAGCENHNNVKGYIASSLSILFMSGLSAFILIIIFRVEIVSAFNLDENNAVLASSLLPYIGVLSVYVVIVQAVNSVLSGLGRMDIANYVQSVGRVVTLSTSIILLVVGFDINSLVVANFISYLFINIVSTIYIRKIFGQSFFSISNFKLKYCNEVMKVGFAIWGGSLIGLLVHPFNKFMISRYIGVSSLPIYEVALRGCEQLRAIFETSLRALMPEISRHAGKLSIEGCQAISKLNKKANRLILVWGGGIYLGLFVFAGVLLEIWLGSKFVEEIVVAFRLLQVGSYFSLLGVPAYFSVIGMGKPRYAFMASAIQSAGNFLLVAIVVLVAPTLDITAFCLAPVIGMLFSTIFLMTKRKAVFNRLELIAV